jgi:outer membrane protein OmpA-like peptidoglycan-associated protein
MRKAACLVVTLICVGLALGCAHDPPAALLSARGAYAVAASDPEIQSEAPVPLHEAKQALDRANRAWDEAQDEAEVRHLAYLAERRVEIATELARRSAARKEAQALGEKRAEVLLEARSQEASLAREQAARAEQRAARLAAELEELEARQTERGLVLTLGDVLFDVDRAELKPGAEQHLLRLAAFLQDNPERSIVIEGHTDSTGSPEYNLDLSQRRADSVRRFVQAQGIGPERIVTRGYGLAYPIASNDTAAGRQQNRRVEIVILEPGAPASAGLR